MASPGVIGSSSRTVTVHGVLFRFTGEAKNAKREALFRLALTKDSSVEDYQAALQECPNLKPFGIFDIRTPLMTAALTGRTDVLELLLKKVPKKDLGQTDFHKLNLLHYAALDGRENLARVAGLVGEAAQGLFSGKTKLGFTPEDFIALTEGRYGYSEKQKVWVQHRAKWAEEEKKCEDANQEGSLLTPELFEEITGREYAPGLHLTSEQIYSWHQTHPEPGFKEGEELLPSHLRGDIPERLGKYLDCPPELMITRDLRGLGIRAKTPIKAGETICLYTGDIREFIEGNEPEYSEYSALHVSAARRGDVGSLINDGPPNAGYVPASNGLLYVVALEDIAPEREICTNYGLDHSVKNSLYFLSEKNRKYIQDRMEKGAFKRIFKDQGSTVEYDQDFRLVRYLLLTPTVFIGECIAGGLLRREEVLAYVSQVKKLEEGRKTRTLPKKCTKLQNTLLNDCFCKREEVHPLYFYHTQLADFLDDFYSAEAGLSDADREQYLSALKDWSSKYTAGPLYFFLKDIFKIVAQHENLKKGLEAAEKTLEILDKINVISKGGHGRSVFLRDNVNPSSLNFPEIVRENLPTLGSAANLLIHDWAKKNLNIMLKLGLKVPEYLEEEFRKRTNCLFSLMKDTK